MSEIVLLSASESNDFMRQVDGQRVINSVAGDRQFARALLEILLRYNTGVIRVFSNPARDVFLCCSPNEAAGLDALYIDYIENRGRPLQQIIHLLHDIARSAQFERVACYPVTESRARLYRRLGFRQSGEFYYLDVEQ